MSRDQWWLPAAMIGGTFVAGAVFSVAARAGYMVGEWLLSKADADVMRYAEKFGECEVWQ